MILLVNYTITCRYIAIDMGSQYISQNGLLASTRNKYIYTYK